MRLLGATLATAALLLSATTVAGEAAAPQPCRQRWADLAQLHGENGNPEGSGSTRLLQQRWDS